VIPRTARALALAAACLGLAVPLVAQASSAQPGCGLAPRPAAGHKHIRTGDLTGPVRLYGDSITYQAWERLAARRPELGVDAFWGRWTRSTVDAVLDDAAVKAPEMVVLAIGTNDTRDPSDMAAEVRRARESLPSSTRLLWVNTYVETNRGWADVDAAIASTPGVETIDWALENLRAKGLSSKSPLLSDGVHLSCPGGDVWVDLVQRATDRPSSPHHTSALGPAVALADFRYDQYPVRTGLPAADLPYAETSPLPRTGAGLVDKHGVRVVRVGGTLYDHPAAQARYGLTLLESYRLTHDARYLAMAQAQADRLVSRRVVEAGAWFYPYPFDHRGPGGVVRRAPWYSGLGQGQALSLFTRLAQVTGSPVYRTAAHLTFASLLVPPSADRPWVSRVSEDQLWVEQYPNGTSGSRTLAGHVYAAFGLYDYWLDTQLPLARTLLQGALTTAVDAARRVRVPGEVSHDGTVYGDTSADGHATRVQQLLELQAITGLPGFARLADALHADHPDPDEAGRLRLLPGEHTGYRFAPDGSIVGRRTVQLAAPSLVASPHRVRMPGRKETWLEAGSGPLAGYFVRENPARAYRIGITAALSYPVQRRATLRTATPYVYRVASDGRLSRYDVDLRPGDRLAVNRWAVLDGVRMLRVSAGLHEAWWVPATAVRLD
jgi:hypothetical protein